jgi:hypothetical protein
MGRDATGCLLGVRNTQSRLAYCLDVPDASTDARPEVASDVETLGTQPPSTALGDHERQWPREVIALGIVALAFAVPLRGLLRAAGPPMEEGFMLVFPERVLKGDLPNRDFLHLYGPGSVWAIAGAFKAFGVSLITERMFGLVQQMLVVFGIYALARRWNRVLAVTSALTSALIIIPFGLTALAWVGAVGLGLFGAVAGMEARARTDDRVAGRFAIASGACFGLALLFRLDLIVAVTLVIAALVWGLDRARRNRLLAGCGVAVVGYLIHLASAGPGNVIDGMIIEPVFELRGGRSLPVPPPWDHYDGFLQKAASLQQLSWPLPDLEGPQQLFIWFILLLAVVALLLYQGWRLMRRDPTSLQSRTMLVVALFSVGILPQAIQRVDSAHFAWVGCVPLGFLPVALFELGRRRGRPERDIKLALATGVFSLAVLLFVIPTYTVTRYSDYVAQTFNTHRFAYAIKNDGRTFYYGTEERAAAANEVIAEAERISRPGQKLFVGTGDLRKTPYSDAYLYFMLPKLDPGTRYIEMDPGMANTDDSGLDRELATSDLAILSKIWDHWEEPNDSRKFGSDKASRVLADHFCLVGSYQNLYELYQRCR